MLNNKNIKKCKKCDFLPKEEPNDPLQKIKKSQNMLTQLINMNLHKGMIINDTW
jgi:hypothetical protein